MSIMELDPYRRVSGAEEGGHHKQQRREKYIFSIVAVAISESITTKPSLWHTSALIKKKKVSVCWNEKCFTKFCDPLVSEQPALELSPKEVSNNTEDTVLFSLHRKSQLSEASQGC